MVVSHVRIFLHRLAKLFLAAELVQARALVLERVEVTFHGRVVVRAPRPAHALGNVHGLAELDEGLRRVLAPLVAVQDQTLATDPLGFERLPQGADGEAAGDVPVGQAGDNAAVVQVDDRAVVADLAALQEQVGEIRAPLLVRHVRAEVPAQQVFEHLVRLPVRVHGPPAADDGPEPDLPVHVLVDGCGAEPVSRALQVDSHDAVAVDPVVAVVNLHDLLLHLLLSRVVARLPVPPVVVVGVRADAELPEQPADAELLLVLVDESIRP